MKFSPLLIRASFKQEFILLRGFLNQRVAPNLTIETKIGQGSSLALAIICVQRALYRVEANHQAIYVTCTLDAAMQMHERIVEISRYTNIKSCIYGENEESCSTCQIVIGTQIMIASMDDRFSRITTAIFDDADIILNRKAIQGLLGKFSSTCRMIALSHSQKKSWKKSIPSPVQLNTSAYGVPSATQHYFLQCDHKIDYVWNKGPNLLCKFLAYKRGNSFCMHVRHEEFLLGV